MRNFKNICAVVLFGLVSFAAVASGVDVGHVSLAANPDAFNAMGVGLVAAGAGVALPRWRMRDIPFTFDNVVGTGLATLKIPRYDRTLLGIVLKLGGTTFTKSLITEWKLKLGNKTLSAGTGADLNKINNYLGIYEHANFLKIDFTDPVMKMPGAEAVGGYDLTQLPAGQMTLEVRIVGATAPTLEAQAIWGAPQKNDVVKRLLQFPGALTTAGRNTVILDVEGGDIARLYMMYNGADFCGTTATATAWSGNTSGAGAMGTITVAAGCQVGTHKIFLTEIVANAGTFAHQTPDGRIVSAKGNVASAYSGGGLSFTLADATDYVPGDGFDIEVGAATEGNVYRVEAKVNGVPVFDRGCLSARYEQLQYGLKPQSKMLVADFVVEGNLDGLLKTEGAKSLEFNYWATGTDTFTIYAETFQRARDI